MQSGCIWLCSCTSDGGDVQPNTSLFSPVHSFKNCGKYSPLGRQLADNGSGPALSATPGDQGRGTAPYIQLELYILLYSASNIQLCIYSASTTYPPASCIWLQLDTSNKNQFKYSLPFIQLHIYNNSVFRFKCTFIQLLIYIPPSILLSLKYKYPSEFSFEYTNMP